MAIISSRTIQIQLSGDVTMEIIKSALDNAVSPGEPLLVTLAIGNNTITAPVISGIIPTGLTIVPPAGNTNVITLKGANGDTGIALHETDPTSLALDEAFVSLVLSVLVQINGVQLVWT